MKLRSLILSLAATTLFATTSFASSYRNAVISAPNVNSHSTFFRLPPSPKDALLYGNGSDDGANAYNISTYAVTNSFVLNSSSTLNSVTFSNWFFPSDSATTVDWAITTGVFSGTTLASGTASLTGTLIGQGLGFYDIYSELFSLGGVNLGAGTYYLQLSNEGTAQSSAGYWGESGGASLANQSTVGGIISESFSINGSNGTPSIPEPGSLVLFGTGLLGVAGVLRRKFSV
ncbi:MAG: PEP-CTERM sorting domain-containing protein [Acidobacteriaceae bacterium]